MHPSVDLGDPLGASDQPHPAYSPLPAVGDPPRVHFPDLVRALLWERNGGYSIVSRDDRPSATHELSLRSGRAALSAGIAWCNMASSAARSERARAEIINMSSGCRLEHHLWRMARCRFQVTPECLTHSCGIRPSAIGYSTSLRHAGGVLAA